ncbi:hypothetical protein [Sphingomonas paucimobilis]|uniref:hypothetical protein n=1 Tax=Sphingomonas paucimobilis TaxID=13689 RepID=UPI000AD4E183|nr:hypothetical protein [Sphingomonas paucimobilis]
MDVLHAAAKPPRQRVGYPPRQCPECMAHFKPQDQRQLFCSTEHRVAWNNRATVRGRVLTCYSMAARQTRDGTRGDRDTGKRAAQISHDLMQRYRDEDREAGRMDAVSFAALRFRHGFEPI